ncbi:hypothetical protein NIE88_14915 [Sporolactobacillus shoreicorticis]|uniref:Uncharacterized protein n=1 Tax=Sporolactobacillus shoreicorticis TaxID=1923877 RepID=A0ABW5S475_9BACL|nr:hypothetical protein [Sporolactobacillus shoreicorticis]MCO7127060.1 hypothetical protein [Sporolactobacillus shoreicorticis]
MSVIAFLPAIIMLISLSIIAALIVTIVYLIRHSLRKRNSKSERQAELEQMKIDDLE